MAAGSFANRTGSLGNIITSCSIAYALGAQAFEQEVQTVLAAVIAIATVVVIVMQSTRTRDKNRHKKNAIC